MAEKESELVEHHDHERLWVAEPGYRLVVAERDRCREALERLTDALTDVRVSGLAARTFALHEAWKDAREALDR